MAARTGPDAWAWLAQARDYVREHRINALTHETANDGQAVAAHLLAYRQAGFRTEVTILAVPAAISNQAIIARYREQLADHGHGRLSVQANADQGVLDLADRIDTERLADHVRVLRRGESQPRYRNSLNAKGTWTSEPALREAIERERNRTWTPQETADFLRTHSKLRAELSDRWTTRLDHIYAQAQPYLNRQREHARQAEAQLEAGT